MLNSKEKCISPWFGFLVIVLICVMIAAAVFFRSSGNRHAKTHKLAQMQKSTMQAAFPGSATDVDVTANKLIF